MKKILKLCLYVILIAVAFFALLPLLYAFFSSFKSNNEILSVSATLLPRKWVLDNYKQAWVLGHFAKYTWNSIYLTFFSVLGILLTSSMTGYVFSRGHFRGKKLIFTLITATMFICLGTITLYPRIRVAQFLHINKSLWGIIVMYIFGVNVSNIFLVKVFVDSIPADITEAAYIDGCSFSGTFFKIMLPLIKPILATVSILSFKNVWNDYLLPMVFTISRPEQTPLIVGIVSLKNTGEAATSWNLMLAGTMISIIPMVIVYLCFNRYFVEGLTAGAVKG